MNAISATLNPAQRAAIERTRGATLVLAGAGSGKTRVITHKIAHMLCNEQISAHRVCAVTFTNKAAREMKERVQAVMPEYDRNVSTKGLVVSTFHSLGLRMIQRELKTLGLRKGFSILDGHDTGAIVRDLMKQSGAADNLEAGPLLHQISNWKSALITPDLAEQQSEEELSLFTARLYRDYQRLLRAYNAVDFDDLVLLPVELLRGHTDIRNKWQHRIRHLLVDEYQDTNGSQYELLKLLIGPAGNLTAVGDDDQSIYAWRGAQPENLLNLKQDYPQLELVKLEQNYRSTSRILRAANTVIDNNPHIFDKALWSDIADGEMLRVIPTRNAEDESFRIVSEMIAEKIRLGAGYGQFAILYRSNFQARLFESALRERNIPYRLSGGQSFFEKTEIKDCMAYMRLLGNPDDDMAFLRVVNTPRREIGAVSLEKLANFARRKNMSLFEASFERELEDLLSARAYSQLIQFSEWLSGLADRVPDEPAASLARRAIEEIQYDEWLKETASSIPVAEKRYENVLELIDWIDRTAERREIENEDNTLSDVVAHLSLMDILDRQKQEKEEEENNAVEMMTLHAAKGLEFDYVYLVGMEEELLPHRNSMDEAGIEEERRLAYVGITRARKTLTMSYCKRRRRFGEEYTPEPSRFLDELPTADVRWEGKEDQSMSAEEQHQRGQSHLDALKAMLAGK
jgi:ATP-dependent DNA helicase Rep